jgi:glycosyltransferase involved in cell wall biosynthesis
LKVYGWFLRRAAKDDEQSARFENFLSVVAIAKNEGRFFQEWLEYHKMLGVDKFYIYDNDSSDNTREVLRPYMESGLVEYVFWPGKARQIPAYRDGLKRAMNRTKWLAFIDLDEFIAPISTKTIPEFLREIPPRVGQLCIGWATYGPQDYKETPGGLVIENYTKSDWKRGKSKVWLKSIVNPRKVLKVYGAHRCFMCAFSVDENIEPIHGFNVCEVLSRDRIRISHYRLKSKADLLAKRARGDVAGLKDNLYSVDSSISKLNRRCRFHDAAMTRFVPALKKAMRNPGKK